MTFPSNWNLCYIFNCIVMSFWHKISIYYIFFHTMWCYSWIQVSVTRSCFFMPKWHYNCDSISLRFQIKLYRAFITLHDKKKPCKTNAHYKEYGILKLMKLNIFLISFANLCFEKYLYILLLLHYTYSENNTRIKDKKLTKFTLF